MCKDGACKGYVRGLRGEVTDVTFPRVNAVVRSGSGYDPCPVVLKELQGRRGLLKGALGLRDELQESTSVPPLPPFHEN